MVTKSIVSEQAVTGLLLIFSFILFLPGGLLFTRRVIFKQPSAQSLAFLIWERGFVMAAVLCATLGLVSLARLLEAAGDRILPSLGVAVILIEAALLIMAETFYLSRQEWLYAPVVVAVILDFLGQAVFGASILRSGLLPAWVGWTTIVWNLAWLIILPIARPHDMYYPWLQYVAPVIIGIVLLI